MNEWIRLQQALDATEEEVARLQMVRDSLERERDKAQALAATLSEDWHRIQKEHQQLRTALLEFIHAYANVERLDRDGTEIKLFTAWIRGCALLGIKAEGHEWSVTGV